MARTNRNTVKLTLQKDRRAQTVTSGNPSASCLAPPDSLLSFLTRLNLKPDPTQLAILQEDPHRCVINCSRQWGKSTVTAAKAVHMAITKPNSLTLVLSPSARQSGEFLQKARRFLSAFDIRTRSDPANELSLVLPNASRIVGLPAREDTTRGFSGTDLLIVDEAARVSDKLYQAVRPSLAASNGQLWIVSTPAGRRGFFYDACISTGNLWRKIAVPATACSRISPAFLAEERLTLSDHTFRQEYLCEFLDSFDTVFPSDLLQTAFIHLPPLPVGYQVRGSLFLPEDDLAIYRHRLFIVSVDLGQVHNYTAICILELATIVSGQPSHWDYSYPTENRYTVRHLERLPLGTTYPNIVRYVCSLLRDPSLEGQRKLVIDATGGGRPVVDMFREAHPDAILHPITITSGGNPTRTGDAYHVPRRDLLTSLEISFQSGILKISQQIPAADALLHELVNLRRTVRDTGESAIEQTNDQVHDDLVFATAMANWKAVTRL